MSSKDDKKIKCQKVRQERQRLCEQIWGQSQKEVAQKQSSGKHNNLALFDKATYDKLWKKVLNYKLLPLRD